MIAPNRTAPTGKTPWAGLLAIAAILAGCAGADDRILPGTRTPIRADTGAASGAVEDAPQVTMRSAETPTIWGHENGRPSHQARHVAIEYPLTRLWSLDIGRGSSKEGRLTASPVVADGRIFTLDAAANVRATSVNGAPLWSVSLTPDGENDLDGFGGGVSYAAGKVFATSGFGEIVTLDAETGAEIWRQKLDAAVRAAPTVLGNKVFAVARNDQAFGVDVDNGRVRWRTEGIEPEAGIVGGASPAAEGALVVIPFASGEVVGALARNGRRIWSASISGGRRGTVRSRLSDITGDPVISGDTVYVANQSGRFVALDRRTGERKWIVNEGSMVPALPVGGSVYLMTDQAQLIRINAATGATIWSVQLPLFENPEKRRSAYVHSGPILAGGRILIASADGQFRSFDPQTGALLGMTAAGGNLSGQPAFADGRVFAITDDGTLAAFQ